MRRTLLLVSSIALLTACVAGARGQVDPRFACEQSSECTILPRGCCPPCGVAMPRQLIAVNAAYLAQHDWRHCGDVGCPRCLSRQNHALIPECTEGACTIARRAR